MKRFICGMCLMLAMMGVVRAEKGERFFKSVEIQNITVTKNTDVDTKENYNQITTMLKIRIRDNKKIAFPLTQKYLKNSTVHLVDEWGREYPGDVMSVVTRVEGQESYGEISVRYVIPEKEAKGIKELKMLGDLTVFVMDVVDGGVYKVPLENGVIVPVKVPDKVALPKVNLEADLVWGEDQADDYLSIEGCWKHESGKYSSVNCQIGLFSNASLPVVALMPLDEKRQVFKHLKNSGAFIGQRPNINKHYVMLNTLLNQIPANINSLLINVLYGVNNRDVSIPVDIKLGLGVGKK